MRDYKGAQKNILGLMGMSVTLIMKMDSQIHNIYTRMSVKTHQIALFKYIQFSISIINSSIKLYGKIYRETPCSVQYDVNLLKIIL